MTIEERNAEEAAVARYAKEHNTYAMDVRTLPGVDAVARLLPAEHWRKLNLVPLNAQDKRLDIGYTLAVARDAFVRAQEALPSRQLNFYPISQSSFNERLRQLEVADFFLPGSVDLAAFHAQIESSHDKSAFVKIAQLAWLIGATDIHIEPTKTAARVRLRVDGALQQVAMVRTDVYNLFLSDLETQAGMKWGTDAAQSGRISIDILDSKWRPVNVNVRLETIPAFHGEEIVARLFNIKEEFLYLENMGLSEQQRNQIEAFIKSPHGLLLTVGPTGSGKTSTLYALLNQLNRPEVKIVTLEDPVEYDLEGISQIPVSTEDKESFGGTLRAVLREDPNIIMIGEIRDADTAKTALQASLTGHLVFSTFHANSAAAAVTRLMDMIGENPLLASALRLVIAQRLVRRLCAHCREEYKPNEAELNEVKQYLKDIPPYPVLYKAGKCGRCNNTGYHGQVAVYEQLSIEGPIEEMIASGTAHTTASAIETAAVKNGMERLKTDGYRKVVAGKTSIEEIRRVLG